jgi:hypothetical protein
MGSRTRAVLLALLATLLLAAGGSALADPLDPAPPDETNHCLDPDGEFDPTCLPGAAIGHNLRQACDYQFLPGCDLTAFERPGYAVDEDPSPGGAFAWKVGAVHEHSGYSDGDPGSVPRDYFTAARTGVNGDGSGVTLDFLFSSEHSDNAQITPTTNANCLTGPEALVECGHFTDNDFYWKWPSTLRQAVESTGDGFTAIRGFEWTNDLYNHMNVFFSTNFRNVKIDGSYLTMNRMWEWLQRPVEEGGGADGLVTFNHPGGDPKLSPVDGGLPHTQVLAATGISNWNDLAYVPAVDKRVVGMELNGGEDIEFYVKALTKGWHIGAVAAEDHHERNWASRDDHKTLILTKGITPQDYYWAFANRRTVAIQASLVEGVQGQRAVVPTIDFTADGTHVLGSIVDVPGPGAHSLRVDTTGLPAGSRVAIIGSAAGQSAPIQLGAADALGELSNEVSVTSTGDDWYFAVVCPPAAAGAPACGTNQNYVAVTAPIWFE